MDITTIAVTIWFIVATVYTINGIFKFISKFILKKKPQKETEKTEPKTGAEKI